MKPNLWPKLRKVLAKYLEPGCPEDEAQFEREIAPFFGQEMYPSIGLDGYWFVLEGIKVAAPSDVSGSVRCAYLIGEGPRGQVMLAVRKGVQCWLCSTAEPLDLILRKSSRVLYRALSHKMVAQLVARELVNDEVTEG